MVESVAPAAEPETTETSPAEAPAAATETAIVAEAVAHAAKPEAVEALEASTENAFAVDAVAPAAEPEPAEAPMAATETAIVAEAIAPAAKPEAVKASEASTENAVAVEAISPVPEPQTTTIPLVETPAEPAKIATVVKLVNAVPTIAELRNAKAAARETPVVEPAREQKRPSIFDAVRERDRESNETSASQSSNEPALPKKESSIRKLLVSTEPLTKKTSIPAETLLAHQEGPAPQKTSLLEQLATEQQAASEFDMPSDECPICTSKLNDPNRCADCGSSVWPTDPFEFFTNRNVNRERLAKTISLLEIGRVDFRTHMRLALAHCNRLEFAQARTRLQYAMVQANHRAWPVSQRTIEYLKRQTVLVVDDSATIRDVLIRLLNGGGFLPVPVADSWDVKTTILAQQPAVVLLDVTMPIMDGYDVCKQIRADKSLKSLPVIMVSGNDGLINKVSGRLAGATDYVCKPFKPDQLLSLIRKHAAKAS